MNACLHNRWSRQTPPAVYVYEDRIEVVSVGGLPEGLSLPEFYEGKSKPVNLALQQIMVRLDYIEQTGHGVPLIVSRLGKDVFNISENFITVTIPFNRGRGREEDDAGTAESNYDIGLFLDKVDVKIIELMQDRPDITFDQLAKMIEVSRTTINNRIARLKRAQIVVREGTARAGRWHVRRTK